MMKRKLFFATVIFTALNVSGCLSSVLPKPADANHIYRLSDDLQASETATVNQSCLLYTSPSPRDLSTSRMPSSA